MYLGPVEIIVSPALPSSVEAPQDFYHWVNFNPVDSEFFLAVLPFEDDAFFVRLRAADNLLSVRVEAVQN